MPNSRKNQPLHWKLGKGTTPESDTYSIKTLQNLERDRKIEILKMKITVILILRIYTTSTELVLVVDHQPMKLWTLITFASGIQIKKSFGALESPLISKYKYLRIATYCTKYISAESVTIRCGRFKMKAMKGIHDGYTILRTFFINQCFLLHIAPRQIPKTRSIWRIPFSIAIPAVTSTRMPELHSESW